MKKPYDEAPKDILTGDIMEIVKNCDNIEMFLSGYVDCFEELSLKDYLNILIEKYGLKKATIIKKSQLGEPFTRQLFSGIKSKPSRDKVISLALAMEISLQECQKLLRIAKVNELYPKNRRDAIVIFALTKKLSVPQVNELLYEKEEFTL